MLPAMRKIFHFDSPREKYRCDASVVSCFDNRFDTVSRKLLKRIGVVQPDAIRIAGGAKALASPEEEIHRAFVLEQIRKSIRLHGSGRAVLMLHSDCGAYGGLAAFNNDPAQESENHNNDLMRAAAFLQSEIPGLTIKAFYVDFDGVFEVELNQPVGVAV